MKPKAKGFFCYVPMRFISKESFLGASIWFLELRVVTVSFSFMTPPSLLGARLNGCTTKWAPWRAMTLHGSEEVEVRRHCAAPAHLQRSTGTKEWFNCSRRL